MSADSAPRAAGLACILLLGSAAIADPSQGPRAPRPKWWLQGEVQRALRLTQAQVWSLEWAFRETLPQRKALGRELEEQRSRLRDMDKREPTR
jgi:hypothetical protein